LRSFGEGQAKLIELFGRLDADQYLQIGKAQTFAKKAAIK
jgi:hypothetical protein